MEQETRPHDADEDWSQLTHELMAQSRVIRMCSRQGIQHIEARGRFSVLHALHHTDDGATPSELASRCRVSTARIAQMLNSLEEGGLVTRTPSEKDRRRVVVRLTEAGECELASYFNCMNAHVAGLLKELGPEDARELVRLAGRMAQIMQRREAKRDAECGPGRKSDFAKEGDAQ